MTDYFFDSSALIKRYITETGTNWVRSAALYSSGNVVFISQIALVEVVSALSRRKRDGTISPRTAQAARLLLGRHAVREYEISALVGGLVNRAQDLLDVYSLRALDAIQLATASELNKRIVMAKNPPLVFVCADIRLLTAATGEGLQTHQPV